MSEPIRPFSNIKQYYDWHASNCERCKKGYFPNIETVCQIEHAINMAYLPDGFVSEDIARRMGFLDYRESYVWQCGEVDWIEAWTVKEWEAKFGGEK